MNYTNPLHFNVLEYCKVYAAHTVQVNFACRNILHLHNYTHPVSSHILNIHYTVQPNPHTLLQMHQNTSKTGTQTHIKLYRNTNKQTSRERAGLSLAKLQRKAS